MAKVAFLGLGVMGYPMAGHLKTKGGHEVTVYNRTAAKAEKWVAQFGGKSAADAEGRRRGPGFRHGLRRQRQRPARGDARAPTAPSPAWARARSSSITPRPRPRSRASFTPRARKPASTVIDAPVSGGQAGAENGVLTVMCGGDAEPFARAEPVIAAYARACNLIGDARRRPAHQDGQPDLHRRPGAGPRRGAALRQESRPRHREGDRHHLQGRGAILADGEPLQDHGGRQVRFRLRRRLDAQGSRHLPRRGAPQRRAICRSPRWSISSIRRCRRWAASAGIRRA